MPATLTTVVTLVELTDTKIMFSFERQSPDVTYTVVGSTDGSIVGGTISGDGTLQFVTDGTLVSGVAYTFKIYTVIINEGDVEVRSMPSVNIFNTRRFFSQYYYCFIDSLCMM